MGKIDSTYEYFSLHDYIYTKPDNIISIKNLDTELIEIEEEIEDEDDNVLKKLLDNVIESNKNE